MEPFHREPTEKTPAVHLNPDEGSFTITGSSAHPNPVDFYNDIYMWLESYVSEPAKKTVLEMDLNYVNASSMNFIVGVLRRLETLHEEGSKVVLVWQYDKDDEDMQETGEDLKEHFPFQVKLSKKVSE